MADPKEHAHELIDRIAPGRVEVVVELLEIILDPVARSLAKAPFEDEPISEEENLVGLLPRLGLKTTNPFPTKMYLPSSASAKTTSNAWAKLRSIHMNQASNYGQEDRLDRSGLGPVSCH